jgi:hypothetical protein
MTAERFGYDTPAAFRRSRSTFGRDTHHPNRTQNRSRLTRISTGQAPYDLARPKGFEP